MAPFSTSIALPDLAATERLAERLAPLLRPGDTILLSGPIGAGKSAFSRALIRHRLDTLSEDVPSPTFTLVQTYDDPAGDIWHCDLYRLFGSADVAELGLDDAFATAICIVEWPDRLGSVQPADPLHLAMAARDRDHAATLTGSAAWRARLGALLD